MFYCKKSIVITGDYRVFCIHVARSEDLVGQHTMKLKRIHLFEFEDFPWFPDWLRQHMTLYIVAMHRLLGTHGLIAPLIKRCLDRSERKTIIDLCSGAGGPMREVMSLLRRERGLENVELTLSDLYPNKMAAADINSASYPGIRYKLEPVDATDVDLSLGGVRTMICSMHHMRPEVAQKILQDAAKKKQPLCVFEISDNALPIFGWWLAFPVGFFVVLIVSSMIRPMTWRQLVFTYLIPILPLLIAWDGSVSNARTYTKADLETLLGGVKADGYTWEVGSVKNKGNPGSMIYLLGLPS